MAEQVQAKEQPVQSNKPGIVARAWFLKSGVRKPAAVEEEVACKFSKRISAVVGVERHDYNAVSRESEF